MLLLLCDGDAGGASDGGGSSERGRCVLWAAGVGPLR